MSILNFGLMIFRQDSRDLNKTNLGCNRPDSVREEDFIKYGVKKDVRYEEKLNT